MLPDFSWRVAAKLLASAVLLYRLSKAIVAIPAAVRTDAKIEDANREPVVVIATGAALLCYAAMIAVIWL